MARDIGLLREAATSSNSGVNCLVQHDADRPCGGSEEASRQGEKLSSTSPSVGSGTKSAIAIAFDSSSAAHLSHWAFFRGNFWLYGAQCQIQPRYGTSPWLPTHPPVYGSHKDSSFALESDVRVARNGIRSVMSCAPRAVAASGPVSRACTRRLRGVRNHHGLVQKSAWSPASKTRIPCSLSHAVFRPFHAPMLFKDNS